MPIPQIMKDADRTVTHTYGGSEDITGAAITWALLAQDASWSGDLDTLITAAALFTKTLADGDITITDTDTFTVDIDAADTAALAPGYYWVLVRITLAGVQLGPIATRIELIAHD